MHLDQLGWDDALSRSFEQIRKEYAPRELVPGRVIRQERGYLRVHLGDRSLLARVSGRLEHQAETPEAMPVIGDWVALQLPEGEGLGRIHAVLPRKTALTRRAAGENPREVQVIAANVDTVFVMAALDAELNFRRIERMLALTRASGATPVVLLTKSDLAKDADAAVSMVKDVAGDAEVVAVNMKQGRGLDAVYRHLPPGMTAVLLGPSGVGKSTLANRVLGEARLATFEVREDDRKGRHTTTHRELFVIENGALLIDGPGMREFGVSDEGGAVESFPEIEALAEQCRFSDCQHEREPGCAVRAGIEAGELDPARFESYRKLRGEAASAKRKHEQVLSSKGARATTRSKKKKR